MSTSYEPRTDPVVVEHGDSLSKAGLYAAVVEYQDLCPFVAGLRSESDPDTRPLEGHRPAICAFEPIVSWELISKSQEF